MKLIYAGEKFNKSKFSVFLAGPTPREISVKSWRPQVIEMLELRGFKGSVFIPENRIIGTPYDFDKQVPWEVKGLNLANIICFWIPRNLKTMPAFTTNIEFGEFMHSNKIVVGVPLNSIKNNYIRKRCEMHDIPLFNNIIETIDYVCDAEKMHNNKCERCSGSGYRDSNGQPYKCSICDGKGYLKQN